MSYNSISQKQLSEPFELQIARGQIPGHKHISKFGFNSAVSTSTDTIWARGGDYNWLAAATVLKISSSSVADDAGSTGATGITIEGLDENYNEVSLNIIMDGTTAVSTTGTTFIRIHRAYVTTVGTGLKNAGVIYIYTGAETDGVPDVATTVNSSIEIGDGQTLQAFYTVPAGYTAYLQAMTVSSGSSATVSAIVDLRTRAPGLGWRVQERTVVFRNEVVLNHAVPHLIEEKTDIEMIATSSATTVSVAGTFDLILVKN